MQWHAEALNKCLGCGSLTPNDYCERCFRLKNYGEFKEVEIKEEVFNKFLVEIKKTNDLVLFVADALNLPENFDLIKDLKNVLLVITKRDLLPVDVKDKKIEEYIKGNFIDKVVISSKNNHNYDLLLSKIKKYKKSNNVYVVGYTNAGKSTLINKLIYNYSSNDVTILTSFMPSTTLDTITIKLDDDLTLIDTPGFIRDKSIENYLSKEDLKKTNPKKMIKPLIYQVKCEQIFKIDDLLMIKIKDKTDIIIYMSNTLKIDRLYNKDIDGSIVQMNPNTDLVIPGLGFIKFKNNANVEIISENDILFYKRDSLV